MEHLFLLKRWSRAADQIRVGRGIGLVSLVTSLLLAAILFSGQLSAGPTGKEGAPAVREAQIVAASFTARRADTVLGAFHGTSGTYAGADVSGIAGVRLLRADATSYCLALSQSGVTLYARGPGGDVTVQPC